MPTSKSKKEESRETFSFKRYFWIGAIFLLILAIGMIIFFWYLMQRPVTSVARRVETPVIADKKAVFERFEGKYFSFRHSSDYAVKSHQDLPDANGVILETAFFSSSEVNSKKIALTIENLIGRKMENSANYNLCKVYADKYREEKFSAGEINGVAFTAIKADIFEKVIFIQHFSKAVADSGGESSDEKAKNNVVGETKSAGFIPRENYLAVIALTEPATSDESMEKELEDIVKNSVEKS